MPLIELTGPPCSGKSTALPALLSQFKGVHLDDAWVDKQIGISRWPVLIRFVVREVFLNLRGSTLLGIGRMRLLILAVSQSGWRLQRQINVIRNVVTKFALHELAYKSSEKNLILDEGVFHLPFVFATSRVHCPKEVFAFFPFGYPRVVCIYSEHKTLEERLLSRGHSMLGSNSTEETLCRFVEANIAAQVFQQSFLASIPEISKVNLSSQRFNTHNASEFK